jgi:hypothetical protein
VVGRAGTTSSDVRSMVRYQGKSGTLSALILKWCCDGAA